MKENWKPYLCNVNGKLASILVNLGLRESVPIASKAWLLWVWVYFRSPMPDGLSSSTEAPTLYKIEDELDLYLLRACQAIPCGRITTEGRREFYFYGETSTGLRNAVESALMGFKDYRFDFGQQEDPSWNQYLNVLYPSQQDLQRIANTDILDVLVKKGDNLAVAREVHHWLYFPSVSSRAQFKDAVAAAGFRIDRESYYEGKLPFGISIARIQSIERNTIDDTVTQLLNLSKSFDGEYDGWETPVVTQ